MTGECMAYKKQVAMADNAASNESSINVRRPNHLRSESHCVVSDISGSADHGEYATRAARPFVEWIRALALPGRIRRQTLDSGAQTMHSRHSGTDTAAQLIGERYFRDALALLPLAILMLNERGQMVMVNPRANSLFGYERDELLGKPVELLVRELHSASSAPLGAEPFAARPSRERLPLDDIRARRKDGTEFRAEVELNAFRFDGENVTLASIIDKTDRYELRRQRQDLLHLTRVSTIGQLASSLAHELNQPLTAILSNVQAAQRFMTADPIDLAELRDILDDIVQDDYRASEVIRRIRAVVKKGDLDVMPLDLAGVMRDAVILVRSDAIVRGTSVTLDVDATLPPVQGDRVQLQQVMLNLLLNAFDAMNEVPTAERVVDVTLTSTNKGMVLIAVRDRGHGLTADKFDKIFKPFFTSKPQGLGLGLSISRSIIDMHHGRLWAENNSDRGATFYVALPTGDATQ